MKKQTTNLFSKILLVVIILLTTNTLATFAQQNSLRQQATIREKAQLTMDSYQANATLSDEQRRYDFLQLFTSNARVYNDQLGLSPQLGQAMTPGSYVEQLTNAGVTNTRVELRDVNFETPKYQGGQWRIKVTFKKDISYTMPNGTFISRDDNGGRDFDLMVVLLYDEAAQRCLIEKIVANSGGGGGENDNHSFSLAVRPYFNMGLGNALTISGGEELSDKGKSSAMTFGVDFGIPLVNTKSLILTGNVGLGITMSQLRDLSFSGDYSYMTTDRDADVDGDTYKRTYNGLSIIQSVKLTDVSIPIYLDAELPFGEMLSAYADLGLRLNMNMSNSISSGASASEIYGVYNQYSNIKFVETFGYNGFMDKAGTIKATTDKIESLSGFNADLLAGLGLRLKVPGMNHLQVDLGISYLIGLGNVFSGDGVQLKNVTDKPVIYNIVETVAPYNNTVHVHSLTDAVKGVKRQGLGVKLGVVLKF